MTIAPRVGAAPNPVPNKNGNLFKDPVPRRPQPQPHQQPHQQPQSQAQPQPQGQLQAQFDGFLQVPTKQTPRRMPLVQRFNGLCLKYGVTGVAKGGRGQKKDFAFSKQHPDERRKALYRLVEDKLYILHDDPRYEQLVWREQHLPIDMLLTSLRQLCAVLEAEHGLTPPRVIDSPPPYAVRMRRLQAIMDKNGVTDALESFKDTNSLRYKVYKALSEIDPYFDLNEKEYNALLARSDFSLDMIVAEIHGILVLGRRAIAKEKFWCHYHSPTGCGLQSGPASPASPCQCWQMGHESGDSSESHSPTGALRFSSRA